jgi:hypothetical protein
VGLSALLSKHENDPLPFIQLLHTFAAFWLSHNFLLLTPMSPGNTVQEAPPKGIITSLPPVPDSGAVLSPSITRATRSWVQGRLQGTILQMRKQDEDET